jgi:hypothetical protein
MISEEKAQGKVKEIYEEIRRSLGIDFVPNMYKVIDTLTREIIAVAVSAVMGCKY